MMWNKRQIFLLNKVFFPIHQKNFTNLPGLLVLVMKNWHHASKHLESLSAGKIFKKQSEVDMIWTTISDNKARIKFIEFLLSQIIY
jgi:hypothetical protein